MYRVFSLLPFVFVLAACATPQQQCISKATKTMRQAEKDAARIKGNLARGYAIHRQTISVPEISICYDKTGKSYTCRTNDLQVLERPVAIDVSEEKRKLAALQKVIEHERPLVQKAAATCVADFPE